MQTGTGFPAPAVPAGWEGILEPGERILWQGRPTPGNARSTWNPFRIGFGLFFAGFALLWMILAALSGTFMWMFGLLHFSAGLGIAFGPILWERHRLANSWYTLTDARAIVATDTRKLGKKLHSYPITASSPLTYDPGPLATILFDHPPSTRPADNSRASRRQARLNATKPQPPGFERITEGEKVMALVSQIRRRARESTEA